MILPCLYIDGTNRMGRGVFTSEDLNENTIVETSPVIVMEAKDRDLLDQTVMHDYIFEWGGEKREVCVALGYISLYNHSYVSNCEYEMDHDAQTMSIKTVRFIKAGEELFINYNGVWNDSKKLWFDAE